MDLNRVNIGTYHGLKPAKYLNGCHPTFSVSTLPKQNSSYLPAQIKKIPDSSIHLSKQSITLLPLLSPLMPLSAILVLLLILISLSPTTSQTVACRGAAKGATTPGIHPGGHPKASFR